MAVFNPVVDLKLPWSSSENEDRRYYVLLVIFLLLIAIVGTAIYFTKLPEVDRKEAEKLPPNLAKVIIKKKEEIKKKPPEIKTPEPKKEEKKEEKKKEEPKEKPKEKPPEQKIKEAREKAKNAGILKMKDQLADMRNMSKAFKDLGGLKSLSNAGAKGTTVTRTQIVGKATGTSGGIRTAAVPGSAGMGLGDGSGVASNVDSVTLGGDIGDGDGDIGKAMESGGKSGSRSEESIRAILDQNKASLYAIYNRALREDPSLQGRVTFKLVIEPDGSVSSCSVVSSALNNSGLEGKLVNRIRLINFGDEPVSTTTTNWVMDFLPY